MKVAEILAELRSERQKLDEAILIFERIHQEESPPKKRGRPPGIKKQFVPNFKASIEEKTKVE